jgi:hypothetical protein
VDLLGKDRPAAIDLDTALDGGIEQIQRLRETPGDLFDGGAICHDPTFIVACLPQHGHSDTMKMLNQQ